MKTDRIEEPYIKAQIISKPEYIGNIMTLCLGKRGILINQSYLTQTRVELIFEMPLTEIVFARRNRERGLPIRPRRRAVHGRSAAA